MSTLAPDAQVPDAFQAYLGKVRQAEQPTVAEHVDFLERYLDSTPDTRKVLRDGLRSAAKATGSLVIRERNAPERYLFVDVLRMASADTLPQTRSQVLRRVQYVRTYLDGMDAFAAGEVTSPRDQARYASMSYTGLIRRERELERLLVLFDRIEGCGRPLAAHLDTWRRRRDSDAPSHALSVGEMTPFANDFARAAMFERRAARSIMRTEALAVGQQSAKATHRFRNPTAEDVVTLANVEGLPVTIDQLQALAAQLRGQADRIHSALSQSSAEVDSLNAGNRDELQQVHAALHHRVDELSALLDGLKEIDRPAGWRNTEVHVQLGLAAGLPGLTGQYKRGFELGAVEPGSGKRSFEQTSTLAATVLGRKFRRKKSSEGVVVTASRMTPMVSVARSTVLKDASRAGSDGKDGEGATKGHFGLHYLTAKVASDGRMGFSISPPVLPLSAIPVPVPPVVGQLVPWLLRPYLGVSIKDDRLAIVSEPLGKGLDAFNVWIDDRIASLTPRALSRRKG